MVAALCKTGLQLLSQSEYRRRRGRTEEKFFEFRRPLETENQGETVDSCSVPFNGLLWLPHIKVGLANVCVLEVWADWDVA